DTLEAIYRQADVRALEEGELAAGLKAIDRALIDVARNYAVGDTPGYRAALGQAATSTVHVGSSNAALEALEAYQRAMTAYVQCLQRGEHAPALAELDRAVQHSRATGAALREAVLQVGQAT